MLCRTKKLAGEAPGIKSEASTIDSIFALKPGSRRSLHPTQITSLRIGENPDHTDTKLGYNLSYYHIYYMVYHMVY